MNPAVKLVGFGLILVVSFGAAFGVGRLADGADSSNGRSSTPATVVTTTTMDHGAHS